MFLNIIVLGQIGLGWVFVRYLISQDRGPKEPVKALWFAGILGALAIPIALIAESYTVPIAVLDQTGGATGHQLLTGSFFVGLIEEAAKSLPLAIWLFRKRYFDEMTDGVIYFAISGMVFGVMEDISYTLSLGAGAGFMRILMAPYLHAAFCALFGWALAWHKVGKKPVVVVLVGAVLAVGAHTLYDFGLFYAQWWSAIMSLGLAIVLNVGVFLLLRYAQRLDIAKGLSASGENLYCRACGTPNPSRYMYCTHCGQRT